jgi:hypothetical protein
VWAPVALRVALDRYPPAVALRAAPRELPLASGREVVLGGTIGLGTPPDRSGAPPVGLQRGDGRVAEPGGGMSRGRGVAGQPSGGPKDSFHWYRRAALGSRPPRLSWIRDPEGTCRQAAQGWAALVRPRSTGGYEVQLTTSRTRPTSRIPRAGSQRGTLQALGTKASHRGFKPATHPWQPMAPSAQ